MDFFTAHYQSVQMLISLPHMARNQLVAMIISPFLDLEFNIFFSRRWWSYSLRPLSIQANWTPPVSSTIGSRRWDSGVRGSWAVHPLTEFTLQNAQRLLQIHRAIPNAPARGSRAFQTLFLWVSSLPRIQINLNATFKNYPFPGNSHMEWVWGLFKHLLLSPKGAPWPPEPCIGCGCSVYSM